MKSGDIKEICIKCGAKCCFLGGPVITKKEKLNIMKIGYKDIFIDEGTVCEFKHKNGKCPLLKNNLCSIQKNKPLMCIVWPVYPVFRNNKRRFIILDCPLTKHLSKTDTKKLKKLAKKIPKQASVMGIIEVPAKIKKRLNKFGWDRKIRGVLNIGSAKILSYDRCKD